ncbi:MAG: anti-sigma factor family protein [Planctomycetota bacterium]|jgi:hypothetical protein
MMENEHVEDDLLQAWVEGRIGPELVRGVSEHLTRCPRCSENAETYRGIFRVLEEAPPKTSAGFVGDVMEAVRREKAARPPSAPVMWKAAACAAAAVLFVAGVMILDLHGTGMDRVDRISTGVLEQVPDELPLPGDVDRAVTRVLEEAEDGWGEMVSATENRFPDRFAFGLPVLLIAAAFVGLMNLAALWKLRGDEQV